MSTPLPAARARGIARAWPLIPAAVLIALGFVIWKSAVLHALESRVLLSMRAASAPAQLAGPRWLPDLVRDFVGLGGIGVLAFFIAGGIALLWVAQRRREASEFFIGVFGAFVIASALKHFFARPRPQLVPHEAYTFTASFPSGNTLMATVVWLLLALALADASGRRGVRCVAVTGALAIAFLVGAGRVVLGVHWPSDVVEAWGLGIAWVRVARWAWRARLSGPR